MLRLEKQNEEFATLLLPSKSIVTFQRVGCETSSCVQAARALFMELSHPPLQRAKRGQAAYESLRELEFGISQKGNSSSGQQLLSGNVVLSFHNLAEYKHLLYLTVLLLNSGRSHSQQCRNLLFSIFSPGLPSMDVNWGG